MDGRCSSRMFEDEEMNVDHLQLHILLSNDRISNEEHLFGNKNYLFIHISNSDSMFVL